MLRYERSYKHVLDSGDEQPELSGGIFVYGLLNVIRTNAGDLPRLRREVVLGSLGETPAIAQLPCVQSIRP